MCSIIPNFCEPQLRAMRAASCFAEPGTSPESYWDTTRVWDKRNKATGELINLHYHDPFYRPTGEIFVERFSHKDNFQLIAVTPFYTLGVMVARAILVPVCLILGVVNGFSVKLLKETGERLLGIFTSPFYGTCLLVGLIACSFFESHGKPFVSFVQEAWLQADYQQDIRYKIRSALGPEQWDLIIQVNFWLKSIYHGSVPVLFLAYCYLAHGKPETETFDFEGQTLRRFVEATGHCEDCSPKKAEDSPNWS